MNTVQKEVGSTPLQVVMHEVERAMLKFPTWPTDPLHALAVLGEEFGELTKDMLQLCYEPHKTSVENVRTEAIQTAAMALRLLASLDAYEYRPGAQHAQDAAALQKPPQRGMYERDDVPLLLRPNRDGLRRRDLPA